MDKLSNDRIVQAAEELIEETGKSEVSIPQIAKRLNVTHGALYKHFNSKQDLWEAVAQKWFDETIFKQLKLNTSDSDSISQLHDWLWQFVNAKKTAYLTNDKMFALNTKYIDNNPYALRKVLMKCYHEINKIMNYDDNSIKKAETILAAFSIFTLPNFKDFWKSSDYEESFERMWLLVKKGILADF